MNKWWIALKAAWYGRKWLKSRKREKMLERASNSQQGSPVLTEGLDSHYPMRCEEPLRETLDWLFDRGFKIGLCYASDDVHLVTDAVFKTRYTEQPIKLPVCVNFKGGVWTVSFYFHNWPKFEDRPDLDGTPLKNKAVFNHLGDRRIITRGCLTAQDALADSVLMIEKALITLEQIEIELSTRDKSSQNIKSLLESL